VLLRGILTFVGLVGLLLLGFAAHFAWKNVRYLREGKRLQATVVSSFRRTVGRGSRDYVRVSFEGADGRARTAEGEVAFKYTEGEVVEIAVLDASPEEVLVVNWFSNWWLPTLLALFGLGLGWLGFAQYVRR
jgi:hypothetical protein